MEHQKDKNEQTEMSKRSLQVNWVAVGGAAQHKRKLVLRANEESTYLCPISNCLHVGFKSSRGLRKHIDNKHCWYYYFDEQPDIKREEIMALQPATKRANTSKMPSFSVTEGIGKQFHDWLCTACGGGKNGREAKQSATRAMKFLMTSLDNVDLEYTLNEEFIDCCLGSASIIMKFLQVLEEEWKLSSSASLNYLKSISDLLDFRKASGVTDSAVRCFAVTEVYVRRGKENLAKHKKLEYARNLDLETLISKNSWATIEEMERVIPFHVNRFKEVIESCGDSRRPSVSQLAFATRFIATYLFIRVKCSRPMTYQFLTIDMIRACKANNGFIDQKEFKTKEKFLFDTLLLDEETLEVLDLYIDHIRPLFQPKCSFLLVTNNGNQYTAFTSAMSILVHEAIGKYIHPTRYRQIVETESAERLTEDERQVISQDQKHSSHVAKVAYKKKLSRDIATRGKECMNKLVGTTRRDLNKDVLNVLRSIDSTANNFDKSVLDCAAFNICGNGNDTQEELLITNTVQPSTSTAQYSQLTSS